MERFIYTLVGILALALVATGLTEVTLSLGRSHLADDRGGHVMASPTPTVSNSPAVSAAPSATPVPTVTPAPTPTATPEAATARAVSFVHMRSGPSTATAIVTDLQGGEILTLGAYSDAQWQEVTYGGFHGYIFKTYLAY